MLSSTGVAFTLGSLLLLFLGGVILRRDPKSRLHQDFAAFALGMAGWLASLYLYYHAPHPAWLTAIGRVNFAAIALAVTFGYVFTAVLTGTPFNRRRLILTETLLLVALVLGTPLIAAKETLGAGGHPTTHFGPLFPLFILHLLGMIGAALYRIVKALRRARGERREQLTPILIGFGVTAAIAITTNLVLPYGFGYFGLQESGALSVIPLIAAFAYAIAVGHLFDIRIVIKRTVIFAGLVAAAITLYGALALLATQVLRKAPVSADEFLFNLAAVAVVGITAEPIRRLIAHRTDRWLYQREYEDHATLTALANRLSTISTLDPALDLVADTIRTTLQLKHVTAYVFESGSETKLKRVRSAGRATSPKHFLNEEDGVVRYFTKHPEVTTVTRMNFAFHDEHPGASDAPTSVAVWEKLVALGADAIVPLLEGKRLIGLLVLGEKQSGAPYSRRDLTFLELIRAPAIGAIQRAALVEGDQRKTEFVSIAAHELVTPITGMQGYLSMVLDEGLGEVDSKARGYLDKVYASATRLAALVKDLLVVSRLESGRIMVEPRPVDLMPIIQSAVDEVQPSAAAKHLALSVTPPPKLPRVVVDPNRLLEVLLNLFGNAVKYTPKGSITITVKPDGRQVWVEVADTGLGIKPEDQRRLFEKFYRVRTKETEGISGTGLGLYITKAIVERSGGSLRVKSTPGAGSTFSFSIPIAT